MDTSRRPALRSLALASAAALGLFAPSAGAQAVERHGGRTGISLLLGFASVHGDGGGATLPLTGLSVRFGGAFTDRFHLLGELTLAAMPAGDVARYSDVTGFHAALGLAGEGYIGPRFFVRGGAGVGWATVTNGNTWFLPLPGPRLAGAVGYALWRQGERSFSLSLETSYTWLFNGEQVFNRMFSLGLGVGFDWY